MDAVPVEDAVPAQAPHDSDAESPREDIPLSAKTMTATNAAGGTFGMGIDQFELPKASIQKLARSELPDSVQLRKDSLAALVKSSSVFVSYLTAASHDVAIARGNKTISAAHVLDALRELDFPAPMRKELREQLEAYRALQKKSAAAKADNAARNRAEKRAKAASAKAGDADADADTTLDVATDAADDDETAMDESVDMSMSHIAASDDAATASPAAPAPDAMELEGERHT